MHNVEISIGMVIFASEITRTEQQANIYSRLKNDRHYEASSAATLAHKNAVYPRFDGLTVGMRPDSRETYSAQRGFEIVFQGTF